MNSRPPVWQQRFVAAELPSASRRRHHNVRMSAAARAALTHRDLERRTTRLALRAAVVADAGGGREARREHNRNMDRDDLAQLALDIDRSVEMRQALRAKLARGEFVDLIEEWTKIEQLDHAIARRIRKRSPD